MNVNYKYKMDDKVRTPLHDPGIVTMLGYDDDGCKYYVKTALFNAWYKESELVMDEVSP